MSERVSSLYERIGETAILQLVDHFYRGIAEDELLRKMYPEDLEPAKNRLKLFLIQVLGGPRTYTDKRGHPMLRRRHFQWKIGEKEATHWLRHMHKALQQSEMADKEKDDFWQYIYPSALHMINKT